MPISASRVVTSFLSHAALNDLVNLLRKQDFTVIAPTVRGGVISFAPITSAGEIARGLIDQQEGGSYRLSEGEPDLYFQYVVGPDGPKRYLFPPVQQLCQIHVEGDRFVHDADPPHAQKLALLGVRPCDLAAMRVQDRVFSNDHEARSKCPTETFYTEARRQMMAIAINCTRPSGTCFCESMDTGPQARDGFDLAMTELRGGFVVTVGSEQGAKLLQALPARPASAAELELAELKMVRAREHMGRHLSTNGLKDLLTHSLEHAQWDDVAQRCLSCGNCTMVCPTCFCSTVTDSSTLAQGSMTRTRRWESCFTHQFSYTTAGPVRNTIRGRYRHWFRHKLGTWFDQFGCSGCVGCGRCITWCPVGIDITAEARHIQGTQPQKEAAAATREERS
ncbi:MAG: 4Fe-4S dicluster domain-containing protein [Tepidisphaeraceae bacterium]